MYYPECLLRTNSEVIRPINETIMSLKEVEKNNYIIHTNHEVSHACETPVFFYIYNTENYYHFLYDTLPYLITYFKLKKDIPDLKLLMNYPNKQKKQHYKFVIEFLNLLNIKESDIEIIKEDVRYKNLYISTSYTHDGKSNLPPRKEIYDLYSMIKNRVLNNELLDTPKKIYISRRTWIHNDFTNIGTNYTTRRTLLNETELVEHLNQQGYTEVFTENLSTIEKIVMFNNATHIIGAFGGGICNVLFSDSKTKLTAIESPGFLKTNNRFIYSLKNVELNIFTDTEHYEKADFLLYMRVKYKNIIGEITNIEQKKITISYLDHFVAGWNNECVYKKIKVNPNMCKKLDSGLNSPWKINMEKFKIC
jgi:capsular polysaccharide biosynthesis protein